MARQVSVAFQDLAVRFSEDEWQLLGEGQRALYQDVMRENYETLLSLGTAELLPLSAFLSPTEPAGTMEGRSYAGEGQEPPQGGGPLGGAPPHSLHLTALVQLVKEIPEFLFGEVNPESESGGAGLDGERASPEAAVTVETCPLRGLLSCLPDASTGWPSLATTSSSSSSSSGLPGAGGQGSPLPINTADKPRSTEKEGPEAPGGEPSPPTCSPSRKKGHRKQERGPVGTGHRQAALTLAGLVGAVGISPGSSPLQGLINCLKEILVPGAQHPEVSPRSLPPVPGRDASRLTRAELGPGSPPWGVKSEAASGDCPLQGLLNCLKEIPETPHGRPSASGVQEDPGAYGRCSGGPRPPQTPPPGPGPGAGGMPPVVKTEDSRAQSPPVPASCQPGKWTHSPSATSSQGSSRDTRAVQVPSWGPVAQAGSASSSPLEALEACLKGIPLSGSLPPQPPATSGFRSPQPGDPGSQRPELQPRRSHSEEVAMGPLLALSLQGYVRGSPALPSGPHSTPTSFSSSSSTDGDLDFQSPGGSQGRQPGKGSPVGSSPLQGLENCLREIPVPRPQSASSWSSAGDRGPQRAEPKNWTADKEGLRGEACEPVHLGQSQGETPTRSFRLASPQALTSSSIPICYQRGLKDHGATRPGPWRWLQDGAAVNPCPAPQLEKRPGPGPCQPLGSAHGPLSWKPRVSEESRGLGPANGRPSVAARTQGKPLPRGLPEPPPVAAIPPALPQTPPQPCPCGSSLQQELRGLGAALSEKLDRLAAALAGLSQEVATMRTQVDRLGRRPRGPGPKCQASWPWALSRGPRWASGPAHRHLPYGRQKGPARPKPKILRGQVEGCRAGDASGLSCRRFRPVPQLPPDAPTAEPSGPDCSPSQQPLSSARSCHTVVTAHAPLGHAGGPQSAPSSSVPTAGPPQVACATASVDAEPPCVAALPPGTRGRPKDPSSLMVHSGVASPSCPSRWICPGTQVGGAPARGG
ncbi:protein KRBA1 isoform X3 [Panthera tigris]|uniref:protein KRBA1 isoform X3 n=1 Tax=Panthera tigris TaxID=9694 RepID=UPI001C6F6358|nr:protein KRBA1 isoform X3 [Panthera tigris]